VGGVRGQQIKIFVDDGTSSIDLSHTPTMVILQFM